MEVRIIGQMDNTIDHTFESANRVYDKNGLCPTIPTCAGGGHTPKVIVEDFYANREPRTYDRIAPTIRAEREGLKVIEDAKTTRGADVVSTIRASYYKTGERNIRENIVSGKGYEEVVESRIVAMRGRNPERPTDRTPGLPTEQRLELAEDGIVNTLTSVQKDNLVLESCRMVRTEEGKRLRKAYENGEIHHGYNEHRELEPRKDGICNTLTSVQKDNLVLEKKPELQYRIRKLSERECWRLMDFPDSDFEKASAIESRTQLYKQAGNAIVRAVLMALFLQMNIQGIKNWNDRSDSEKRVLLGERNA